MEDDMIFRQQAVNLFLKGVSINEIALKLGRSRQWVHKWIKRYKTSDSEDWYISKSTSPKQSIKRTSQKMEDLVVSVRKSLMNRQYSQTGALSIMYEIKRLGFKAPSISTINRILKRNDLIGVSNLTYKKGIEYPNHFSLVQQMDLIGPRYLSGGARFYFQNIIDVENHYVGVYSIKGKSSPIIAQSLVHFWMTYGMPDYLQMDNELSFRGSNRYPRSFGIVVRLALANGITPIFIPPAEPWRNGIIEKFNSNLQKYFFSVQKFDSFEDVLEKAPEFIDFHNQNHRYSTQKGKTPNQIKSLCQEHKLVSVNLKEPIPLINGSVIFIRFIRSDMNLIILSTSFKVKKELIYTYVIAEIVVDQHVLLIKQDGIIHHVFPFIMPVD